MIHATDRDALAPAVAAEGYRELAGYLYAAHPSPSTPDDLAAIAEYVGPLVRQIRFVSGFDATAAAFDRVLQQWGFWYVPKLVPAVGIRMPGASPSRNPANRTPRG